MVIRLIATPTNGSTFEGWSGDCTGTGECVVTMSEARNVTATFTRDAVPPATPEQSLPNQRFQMRENFLVDWASTDDGSGVAGYDVRVRRSRYDEADFGPYTEWLTDTDESSAPYTGESGYTYCFSTRARDAAGNASPYSEDVCTTVPVDDRELARTGRWRQGTGEDYLAQTFLVTTQQGASARLAGVKATRVVIVADRCPACGEIDVLRNGRRVRHVNLQSPTVQRQQVLQLPRSATTEASTVEVRVTSKGKRVRIDGIGAVKNPAAP